MPVRPRTPEARPAGGFGSARRKLIIILTAVALVVGLGTAVGPAPEVSAAPAPITPQAASQQAAETDQPVPVLSQTDENSQVVANPDGTFTLTTNRQPVRTQQNGDWVPIDTTLHANPDGTLSPAATVEDVSFSGGGTTPLIAVTDADKSLSLSWPTGLPTPNVSGDTATYSDVLPGVDLQVTAEADSYREVLVVHDAAAAANPALTQLHLTATATGLDLAAAPDGGLSATDANGTPILAGATPIMWDSANDPQGGPAPTATDAGTGQVDPIPMTVPTADGTAGTASATLTLSPPAAALTGPDVTYPVYIDPEIEPVRAHFAVVTNSGWHYYDNTSYDLKVGACPESRTPAECDGAFTARSYFNFDVHYLNGQTAAARVFTAALYVDETHNSAGCTSEPVDLYSSNGISSSTTWPGPAGGKLQEVSANYSDTCSSAPPANVVFNNANVIAQVQGLADTHVDTGTFGLIARDESNIDEWKRFAVNPQLRVTYDFIPSTPTGLDIAAKVVCPGQPVYTRDTTPTVYAKAHDNNPVPVNVGLWFEIYTGGGTLMRYNPAAVSKPSDQLGSWTNASTNTNSTAALSDGVYDMRVRASSLSTDTPDEYSPWTTGHWYFTLDHTPPSTPTITSFDYPAAAWGAPQNAPGSFTIKSSGAAGLSYSFDSSDVGVPTDTDCSYNQPSKHWQPISNNTATITPPTSLTPGYHTMYVKTFDDAHNVSALSSGYVFYVAPTVLGEGPTQPEAETLPLSQPAGQGDPSYNNGDGYPTFQEGPSPLWSGSYQQHLLPNKAGAKFNYTLTANVSADYALGIELTQANHYGTLNFYLDGTKIQNNGEPVVFDGYNAAPNTQYLQLGGAHFNASTTHTLTVEVTSKNPLCGDSVTNGTYGGVTITNYHDNGYAVGVDYITIVPINNVTAANFNAAMNNHGIAVDNTTAADIGPSTSHAGLSQQTLAAAGFAAGDTPTVDGVQFTMPTPNADGTDNVMADGQTIPLPTPVQANNIDLLALSTCGSTADSPSIQLTVNFAADADNPNGSFSSSPIPPTPDWNQPPPTTYPTGLTLAATLPYRDVGTSTDTAPPPHIYHLPIPTQWPDRTTQSITLPNLGSTFTGCTNPALHVLAIATS